MERVKIKKMSAEKLMELLKKDGIEINAEDAAQLLDFFYHFSKLVIKEYFETDLLIEQ